MNIYLALCLIVPLAMIPPTEPTVFSYLPLVAEVLSSQFPTPASPAGWSGLAASIHTDTHKQTDGNVDRSMKTCKYKLLFHDNSTKYDKSRILPTNGVYAKHHTSIST